MDIIRKRLAESVDVKTRLIKDPSIIRSIENIIGKMVLCFESGRSVYFCGNGGSAADAQHLSAELSGKFYLDRAPLPSDALHCNTSFLTAVGNDYCFEETYARLIKGLGKEGDILFGLSTSGNSKNIIKATEQARKMGLYTIAMTGSTGGKLKDIADVCVCVPSDDTPRIQECHITIGHIICELVESRLFSQKDGYDCKK